MVRITSIALITAFILALCSTSALAAVPAEWCEDTISYGIHPWDVKPRRYYKDSIAGSYRYPESYFYLHPDRSATYALHPYYRKRYYAPASDPEAARYSQRRLSDVRYSEERAYMPGMSKTAYCNSYSFDRPSYRVPPYGYWCK